MPDSKERPERSFGTDSLYRGWMTGYAYRASRDLYFPKGQIVDPNHIPDGARHELRSWLETYLNLVTDWTVADSENFVKALGSMVTSVTKQVDSGVTLQEFDVWYEELRGGMRAKMPFATYAADFGAALSELKYLDASEKHAGKVLVQILFESLDDLRSAIPSDSYDIVHGCLELLQGEVEKNASQKEISTRLRGMDHPWASLVLMQKNPDDFVNGWYRVYTIAGLIGATALTAIVTVVAVTALTIIIPLLSGVRNLDALVSDLASGLQSLIPALTAIGLTASVVAKKAWDLLRGFEQREVLFFAKWAIWNRAEHGAPRIRKDLVVPGSKSVGA